MADRSAIEWCDSTFNPWIGCTKVSPACDHCYAEVSAPARTNGIPWGPNAPRYRTKPANWNEPRRWNAHRFWECLECSWRGEAKDDNGLAFCSRCDCVTPLKAARRRVFCASLADVFDNAVDPAWRADLFALIHATPNLDWLLLSKRIGNAAAMMNAATGAVMDDFCGAPTWERSPWPNVWLGATICNQAEADRDVPKLLRVPAAVRFLSIEPMLGAINLVAARAIAPEDRPFLQKDSIFCDDPHCYRPGRNHYAREFNCRWGLEPKGLPGVDWVIVGGESGPHARPMHPEWVRSVRDQCAAAGVLFLFKQWGEWLPSDAEDQPVYRGEHCYIGGPWHAYKVGKKTAGRLLDGITHDGYPEVRRAHH
jgi:protein gp37